LLLGSGPIVIGQGAEFDYSGTQAIKALKEEGYFVILVNSIPATIMTDPELARPHLHRAGSRRTGCRKVIEREKPDALLPTMGGQTALNVAMALATTARSRKHGVELIGANARAIKMAEDRAESAPQCSASGWRRRWAIRSRPSPERSRPSPMSAYPRSSVPRTTLGGPRRRRV